jgi:hypothetical protein
MAGGSSKGKGNKAKKRQIAAAGLGSNWKAMLNNKSSEKASSSRTTPSPTTPSPKPSIQKKNKKNKKHKNNNKKPHGGLQPRPNSLKRDRSEDGSSGSHTANANTANTTSSAHASKKRAKTAQDPSPKVDPKPRRYVASHPLTEGEFMEDSHAEFDKCVATRYGCFSG